MAARMDLLRDLCLAPGPTGFEAAVQEVVRRRLDRLGDTEGDPLGNLWLTIGPETGPLVAVAAHADQIGLIVTHVDEQGFLSVAPIGGVAPLLVPGRRFVVHGRGGAVPAVGGRKPSHIIPVEERRTAPDWPEQFLDIGAAGREAALERIAVGDPVTFAPDFVELAPGLVAAQALDDRAGLYTMIRALELYAEQPGTARLMGLSTVHEETTFMGAKALARRLRPDVVLVVDGDFCSDTPAASAKELGGEVRLGAGPVVSRGAGGHERLAVWAQEAAAAEGLPVQVKAYGGETETDADELMAAGTAATLTIGLPLRYMHSPSEVTDLADLDAAACLVAALARRIGEAGGGGGPAGPNETGGRGA
ncbi:MAG: putative aminopeptidase YsdC [Actinobacteria bacterium ADurb.BinA094]|nr:MAG: putative aminopeptidase YsdC [Actinobacteria bacterium ADurb.BinA094]